MRISEVISALQAIQRKSGDIPVVTGLSFTGYGQEIIKPVVSSGVGFEEDQNTEILVVDLVSSEESLVQTLPSVP